jgi:hypothetical protein
MIRTMTTEDWGAAVLTISSTLARLDRNVRFGGLRESLFEVWKLIALAPTPVRQTYTLIRESDILAVADEFDPSKTDYGLSFDSFDDPKSVVRRLGGFLRALETEFMNLDLGNRPRFTRDWLVGTHPEDAYLVPMSRLVWRAARQPDEDFRSFDQRGLTKVRLIPSIVDGSAVSLIRSDHLDAPSGSSKLFGAALFADPKLICSETETTFVVDSVELADRDAVITKACESAHGIGSLTSVFPELMIDPSSRTFIGDLLVKKPWMKKGDIPVSPKFVVAGSWHEIEAGKRYNVATVFDGHGDVLLRHKKRYPYKDPDGRAEDIHFGQEFEILVLDDALVAFGICLDFCNRCFDTVYGKLDVDFVIVPSCGDAKTMDGHIRTAKDLHDSRKTRAFVVQQAYPPVQNGSGFVLNPDGKPKNWEPDRLLVTAPGCTFSC